MQATSKSELLVLADMGQYLRVPARMSHQGLLEDLLGLEIRHPVTWLFEELRAVGQYIETCQISLRS
jgi:hypothetical protein